MPRLLVCVIGSIRGGTRAWDTLLERVIRPLSAHLAILGRQTHTEQAGPSALALSPTAIGDDNLARRSAMHASRPFPVATRTTTKARHHRLSRDLMRRDA